MIFIYLFLADLIRMYCVVDLKNISGVFCGFHSSLFTCKERELWFLFTYYC